MSRGNRRQSDKSNNSKLDESTKSNGYAAGLTEMEYFWSIELNADNRTHIWMSNDDMEDGDEDFIEYTVFLKSATLGANAVPGEHNLVMLESAGSDGEPQKGCIIHLCLGQNNMTQLDVTVSGKVGPTTFTLAEGSGPVYICGNQLMEFPKDDSLLDNSQTESEEEETEEEDAETEEEKELEKPDTEAKKAIKRKAAPIVGKPKQKAKVDMEEDEEEMLEDDEDEEEEEEDEESEEAEESEEEIKLRKKKGKENGKKDTPKAKVTKKPVKKSKK